MRRVMVRYKVKPDRVAENEALVRAVYDELQRTAARRASLRDVPARRRRQLRPHRRRPRTATTRWRMWRRSRASRRTSRDRCDEGPVVTAAQRDRLVPAMTADARGHPSSTWSCTPATAARERVLLRAVALATGADRCRLRLLPRARAGRRLRRRHRRVRDAAPGLAALRRGRARRRGHRAGGPARRLGAARAARGPGGLAQRRGDARGRRDRVLAAEGGRRDGAA